MQRPAFSVGAYRSTQSEPIGRGSFAYVFRGEHAATRVPCAIKEIDVARLKRTNQKLMEHVESEISAFLWLLSDFRCFLSFSVGG